MNEGDGNDMGSDEVKHVSDVAEIASVIMADTGEEDLHKKLG